MLRPSRRTLLLGGTAAIGAATLMSKPSDKSGPRDPYFLQIQSALFAAGIATPTLVIDRARLNANIDTLIGHLPDGMGYRIVAKSLPSLGLIDHIRQRSGTDRLMTFNLPMLTDRWPACRGCWTTTTRAQTGCRAASRSNTRRGFE